MFETKDIIFIHLPKTGGTFVHKFIEDQCAKNPDFIKTYFKNPGHGYKHATINLEEKKIRKKHVLGTVRNPFDHYVSWYSWSFRSGNIMAVKKDKLFEEWREFRNKFKNPKDTEGFRYWLKMILSKYFINSPIPSNQNSKNNSRSYLEDDIGHSTWLFLKMYYQSDLSYLKNPELNLIVDSYIRTEHLYEDLIKHFRFLKEDFDNFKIKKINSSNRLDNYRDYYDDELIELVYHKDKYLFDKFNYAF
jgi:hypothetical protein